MSGLLRPFLVEVTVTRTVPVVAESRADAEAVALDHYDEDEDDEDDADVAVTLVTEVSSEADLKNRSHWIPWGLPDDDPRRNWTLAEWGHPPTGDWEMTPKQLEDAGRTWNEFPK
jgi:hypothetical protein